MVDEGDDDVQGQVLLKGGRSQYVSITTHTKRNSFTNRWMLPKREGALPLYPKRRRKISRLAMGMRWGR